MEQERHHAYACENYRRPASTDSVGPPRPYKSYEGSVKMIVGLWENSMLRTGHDLHSLYTERVCVDLSNSVNLVTRSVETLEPVPSFQV